MTIELTKEHAQRTKALAVPGGYWSRARQAYCTDDPDARCAAAVMTLFPSALIQYPELFDIRNEGYKDSRPYDFASELGIRLNVGKLGDKSLYEWQDTDAGYLKAIMERDGGAHVGWDRGLGKTLISAAFIQSLGAQRSLIVTRNGTQEPVWQAELAGKFNKDGVWIKGALEGTHEIVVLPDSTSPTKQRKILDYLRTRRDSSVPLVLIIHYQAIRTLAGDKTVNHRDGTSHTTKAGGNGWDALGDWDVMVYDESHRLASYNPNSSKNTQEGRALSHLRRKHVKYAVNLSGSGVMNKPDDLFGQLNFLYPSIYKAKWADWNDRYVDYVMVQNRRVAIGWKLDKLPELHKELGVFMVYRNKSEVFDLPEIIKQDIELDLLPAQQKVYNSVRDEFWAQIESGMIKADSSMDQMNKLRQIATAWPDVPSAKLDFAMAEMEEEPDAQFVIFTWYKRPGRILAERLGDQAVVVDGDVSRADRTRNLRAHEDGKARVLIGSIAVIGESFNFQYCHEAIRLDRHWNPEINGQTIDRLQRNGQTERVTFRDLWSKGTVDLLNLRPNLLSKESMRMALYGQQ
jgi:SNF2 family DNA or RNA helicase